MRAILLLGFLVLAAGCTKKPAAPAPEVETEFQKTVNALPERKTECERVDTEFDTLCAPESGGATCKFKDAAAFNRAIELSKADPSVESLRGLAAQFLNAQTVSRGDVGSFFKISAINCADRVRFKIILPLARGAGQPGSEAKKIEILNLLKARANGDYAAWPSFLSVLMDTTLIEAAAQSGFTKVSAEGKKALSDLKAEIRQTASTMTSEFAKAEGTGPESTLHGYTGDDPKNELKGVESLNFDAMKVHSLMKVEAEKAKAYREKLNQWIVKNWSETKG